MTEIVSGSRCRWKEWNTEKYSVMMWTVFIWFKI